jgi:hypothetical protein
MTMRTCILVIAGVVAPVASAADTRPGDNPVPPVRRILDDWPDGPRKAAEKLSVKYGPPNEATPTMMIWNALTTWPWKRIVVHRRQVPHMFPRMHTDFVEQVIDFEVPPERIAELVVFDGSLSYNRTTGELSSHCDDERMNYVAMNLAQAIVIGRLTVREARKQFLDAVNTFDAINGFEEHDRPIVAEKLLFKPVGPGDAATPDESMIENRVVPREL